MKSEEAKSHLQKQLNAGTTSLVLLSLLFLEKRPMYGYEIAKRLEEMSQGGMPMQSGALYPVLRSLEKQGLLSSQLKPSDAGPARKYYQITAEGKQVLKQWRVAWQDTKNFVDSILEYTNDRSRKKGDRPISRKV